jgi:hypothetical protein
MRSITRKGDPFAQSVRGGFYERFGVNSDGSTASSICQDSIAKRRFKKSQGRGRKGRLGRDLLSPDGSPASHAEVGILLEEMGFMGLGRDGMFI